MRKVVGWTMLGTGVLLLGLSLVGYYTNLGDHASVNVREWESFDASLANELRSCSALLSEAQHRIGDTKGDR